MNYFLSPFFIFSYFFKHGFNAIIHLSIISFNRRFFNMCYYLLLIKGNYNLIPLHHVVPCWSQDSSHIDFFDESEHENFLFSILKSDILRIYLVNSYLDNETSIQIFDVTEQFLRGTN